MSHLLRCGINRSSFYFAFGWIYGFSAQKTVDTCENCSIWRNCIFSFDHVAQLRNWWKQMTRKKHVEMSCARHFHRPILVKFKFSCYEAFLSILLRNPTKYVPVISSKILLSIYSTYRDNFNIVTSPATAGNIVAAGASYLPMHFELCTRKNATLISWNAILSFLCALFSVDCTVDISMSIRQNAR